MPDHKHQFAEWTYRIQGGEIRRLLKHRVKYYFGGGLPGALATDRLSQIVRDLGAELVDEVRSGNNTRTLNLFNYGVTPGQDGLRKILLKRLVERQHLQFDPEKDFSKMLITAGAQQSLYAVLDATINPGDYILSAGPSYLGFVTPAVKLGGKVVLCPGDESGLQVDGVEQAINAVKRESGRPPKLLYVIPDSDNPKGTTLPGDRRRALFDLAKTNGITLVEDAAYKEIHFSGKRLAPIKALDTENRVVAYLASTSKEAGVLRLGYAVLPDALRDRMERAKEFFDLCCPTLTQAIAEKYYALDLDLILKDVLETYRERCSAMLESIQQYFPPGTMTRPQGGFFIWWEAPQDVPFDARRFNNEIGIPNDVLFVPSYAFYPPEGWVVGKNGKLAPFAPFTGGMRLSFSAVPAEKIRAGIERLGNLLKTHFGGK